MGAKPQPVKKPSPGTWWVLLLAVIPIVYWPVFSAGITNWDDQHYILEQPLVQAFSLASFRELFSTKILGSYNPLVMLSFAIDHRIAGNDGAWYHIVNVGWHMLNTLLTFIAFRSLLSKPFHALVIAALFALHPMHVESVAWIAGRKDVMYTCFWLMSFILYQRHLSNSNRLHYITAILCFGLSLLSKPQAVYLPLVLLLLHWMRDQWRWQSIRYLTPFFILSLAFGLFTLQDNTGQANDLVSMLSIPGRMSYSVQALGWYILQVIWPFGYSTLYPFPSTESVAYYIGLLIPVLFTLFFVLLLRKAQSDQRKLVFGFGFFLLSMVFVLHLFAVNSSLIYERFTYLSYDGLAIIGIVAATHLPATMQKQLKWITTGFLLVCAFQTFQLSRHWKNSETLWTHVIESEVNSEVAYNNRATYYIGKQQYDAAYADIQQSISINPGNTEAYNNLSLIELHNQRPEAALDALRQALRRHPEFVIAWMNRAICYDRLQQQVQNKTIQRVYLDSGIMSCNAALSIAVDYPDALAMRGKCRAGKAEFAKSLADLHQAIALQPDYANAWEWLAYTHIGMHQPDSVVNCSIQLQRLRAPTETFVRISARMNDEGIALAQSSQIDQAYPFYTYAVELDPTNLSARFNQAYWLFIKGKYDAADSCNRELITRSPEYKPAQELANMIRFVHP